MGHRKHLPHGVLKPRERLRALDVFRRFHDVKLKSTRLILGGAFRVDFSRLHELSQLEGSAVVCSGQAGEARRIMNLVCGLPSPLRQGRLLAMLQGYFDDSGSEPKSFAFVIAGYILPAEQMSQLADDWLDALHRDPEIKYFKMSEAFAGEGQFGYMGREFRMAKVRKMLAVIHKHNPVGICSFMNWEHFKGFSRYLPEQLGKEPYAPLFFQLIDNILHYQKATRIFPQKIQLDFDDQGRDGDVAIEWYGRLWHSEPPYCFSEEHKAILEGTPRMLNDCQYVPIQAADMLAWVIRNAGTPGIQIGGWEWLYTECLKTVWRYCQGFSQQTWEQLLDGLIGPRQVILS